mmetsp:Transcript_80168/g.166843  ORF Transcript_80168/g.166843 Transcript_80168/m.166843 type:complete len:219 (+) Transcript_80168:1181-1837(+)
MLRGLDGLVADDPKRKHESLAGVLRCAQFAYHNELRGFTASQDVEGRVIVFWQGCVVLVVGARSKCLHWSTLVGWLQLHRQLLNRPRRPHIECCGSGDAVACRSGFLLPCFEPGQKLNSKRSVPPSFEEHATVVRNGFAYHHCHCLVHCGIGVGDAFGSGPIDGQDRYCFGHIVWWQQGLRIYLGPILLSLCVPFKSLQHLYRHCYGLPSHPRDRRRN